MRLIDADEFKDFVLSLPKTGNGHSKTYDESSIERFIDCQPTAYDVDEVVEQLNSSIFAHATVEAEFEKEKDYTHEENEKGIVGGLRIAVEIIKGGFQ